jgi:DNA-binding transcriptional MerR regulator
MNNDSNRIWYLAKDIRKLLGVSSGQLFHWGHTWGLIRPEIKAQGRAYKDKYSFMNLLDIALIKELNELGFEPSKIGQIIAPFEHGPNLERGWKGSIWDYFKDGREDTKEYFEETGEWKPYPGFEKEGLLLLIEKNKDGEYSLGYIGGIKVVLDYLKNTMRDLPHETPKSHIIVNVSRIIKDLEEKTGDKL